MKTKSNSEEKKKRYISANGKRKKYCHLLTRSTVSFLTSSKERCSEAMMKDGEVSVLGFLYFFYIKARRELPFLSIFCERDLYSSRPPRPPLKDREEKRERKRAEK
jgi:hypothetical protein